MKYIASLFAAMMISATSFAQGLPEGLYVKPVAASEMSGHEWFYEQGMDFDTFSYRLPSETNGIRFYLGVLPESIGQVDTGADSSIPVILFNKPAVLYKQCSSVNQCSFHNVVDTGVAIRGRAMWVHVWLTADQAQHAAYIKWLADVNFIDNSPK